MKNEVSSSMPAAGRAGRGGLPAAQQGGVYLRGMGEELVEMIRGIEVLGQQPAQGGRQAFVGRLLFPELAVDVGVERNGLAGHACKMCAGELAVNRQRRGKKTAGGTEAECLVPGQPIGIDPWNPW